MVTEPEAAAIYTARYLKSKMGMDFLKVFETPNFDAYADLLKLEECFVLCDAGGGTVVSLTRSMEIIVLTSQ
jgi:hypothetical protein